MIAVNNIMKFGNQYCKVTEVQLACFYAVLKDGTQLKNTTCDIQPIELSEEILLKCPQFKADNYDTFYIKLNDKNNNTLWLKKQGNNFGVALNLFNSKNKGVVYLDDVDFLHDLQNLVKDLSKTELEINL